VLRFEIFFVYESKNHILFYFGTMALIIMTLSKTTLSTIILITMIGTEHNDPQHLDTHNNDIKRKDTNHNDAHIH
jgi:hypothetical protein